MVALKGQLNEAQDNDTQTEVASGKTRERDETQQAIDAKVASMVKSWTEAGGPEAISDRPAARYVVVKEDRTPLKQMIRRAATLHKVEAILFKDHMNDDGTVAVKFTIGAKAPKPGTANGATSDAPEPSGETPTTATVADESNPPENVPEQDRQRRGFRR